MPHLLPTPAVPASLDVALWFLDKARAADSHLPAQKIQDLVYLAAVEYERAHDGRPLIPAAFTANDIAVYEPNLYRLLEDGRPKVRGEPVPSPIESFLGGIWERFGHVPVQHLNSIVRRVMTGAEGETATVVPVADRPAAPKAPAKSLQTQHGRQVTVSTWRPPQAPKASPQRS